MENLKIKKIYENSIQLRGLILDSIVEIERKIDYFLALYFCDNQTKVIEIQEILFHTERSTLGNKKDMLFIILNRHFKPALKSNLLIASILDDLITHRNIFAHLEVDLLSDKITNDNGLTEIVFKKYIRGKLSPKVYLQSDILKLKSDFKTTNKFLDELIKTSKAP